MKNENQFETQQIGMQAQDQNGSGGEIGRGADEICFKPKGKGSFWVSWEAIKVLLDHKATAMQIPEVRTHGQNRLIAI